MTNHELHKKIERLEEEITNLQEMNDLYVNSELATENRKLKYMVQGLKVDKAELVRKTDELNNKITGMRDTLQEIEKLAGANS